MQFPRKWKRPVNVPFPNVWSKFTSKSMNGKTYEIRIQDATPDRHEEIVDMMCKYYLQDEPLFSSLKISEDELSVMKCQSFFYQILQNKTSLIAVLDNNDPTAEIIATMLIVVHTKEYEEFLHFDVEELGDKLSKLDQLFRCLMKNIDSFQLFEGTEYFEDCGGCAKPEYRGLGIGYQVVLSLEKLAATFDISGCLLNQTSVPSQILAEKIGYNLYAEIFYDEYKDENGKIVFPTKNSQSVKLMCISATNMEDLPEIQFQWKRPTDSPFPQVWHTFKSRPKNGKTYNIRIEDLTPDRFEETLDFMMKYYFTDEPLSVSSKLLEDEISIMIYQYLISKVLESSISILAVLDEDTPNPEIVGLQILSVATKGDLPLPEVPGEALGKMKQIYHDIRINTDPFEILGTDAYLHDWGLCVKPEYQGSNIGYNILLSLQNICKAFGIKGSMIMFTRAQSQIIAERAGFKLYNEIVYNEYKNENGEVIFPILSTKSLKFMGKTFL